MRGQLIKKVTSFALQNFKTTLKKQKKSADIRLNSSGFWREGYCLFLAIYDSNDALMLPALPFFFTPYLLKEEILIGKWMLSADLGIYL